MGNPEVTSTVQAVVDWFGPIDFATIDAEFAALNQKPACGVTNSPTSVSSLYLGVSIGTPEAEAVVKEASPQTYIDAKDPPFFIQHGTADRIIPITQSENFSKRLKEVLGNEKVIYETVPGAEHAGPPFEESKNVAKVIDFLDKYLKAGSTPMK